MPPHRSEFLSEYMGDGEYTLPDFVGEHDRTLEDNPLWDYGLATTPEVQAYMRGELGLQAPSGGSMQQ